MCYNCGCGMTDDDHGNPKNITNKTFRDAAKASEQTIRDAKTKTNTLLTKALSTKAGTKDKKKKLK
jgi:hypothetical protein